MPQLADEYTKEPEAIARERRLRAMLNAPIQAIPSGYGLVPAPPATPRSSGGAVPRTALPAWVQARLDAQEAERRRQEDLAAVEAAPRVQVRPQAAPTRPTPAAPVPRPTVVKPSTGSLADDAALHDPRTRAQRLREILDAPMQGIGAGIGTYADPPPTPRPVTPLTREQEEALFEPTLRQERQAARDGGPSGYNALREEQQLWEVGLAGAQQAEVASESAYERAKDLVRERAAPRPPEPIPDYTVEDPWVLPSEILGVPVTADRNLVQLAYRDMTIFGISPEERAELDALLPDERRDIESLARELWIEAQGRELATRRSLVAGEAQPNPATPDWRAIFELATGQPHPDQWGLNALQRDLVRWRDGFNLMDDLTSPRRNGVILVYQSALHDEKDQALLNELLVAEYPDERARYEAVVARFPLTMFIPDTTGEGTALRDSLESKGPLGDYAANFVGKALSPYTWAFGLRGASSIVPGGIASNLYEEARALGLSPQAALIATELVERRFLNGTRLYSRGRGLCGPTTRTSSGVDSTTSDPNGRSSRQHRRRPSIQKTARHNDGLRVTCQDDPQRVRRRLVEVEVAVGRRLATRRPALRSHGPDAPPGWVSRLNQRVEKR